MNLDQWAATWAIPAAAVADLKRQLGLDGGLATRHVKRPDEAASESYVQSLVRLEAARAGVTLFRNNVGALPDENGRIVRYGLANDSADMNRRIKSADLIGIRPVLVTPEHVGRTIGQFVSREVKHGAWRYTGSGREVAQLAWCNLVLSLGGDAAFAPGVGTL